MMAVQCGWRVKCVKECKREKERGRIGHNSEHLRFQLQGVCYLPQFYSGSVPCNVTLSPQAQPTLESSLNKSPIISNVTLGSFFARVQ